MLQHNSRKPAVITRQLPKKGKTRVLTDHIEISKTDNRNVRKEIIHE